MKPFRALITRELTLPSNPKREAFLHFCACAEYTTLEYRKLRKPRVVGRMVATFSVAVHLWNAYMGRVASLPEISTYCGWCHLLFLEAKKQQEREKQFPKSFLKLIHIQGVFQAERFVAFAGVGKIEYFRRINAEAPSMASEILEACGTVFDPGYRDRMTENMEELKERLRMSEVSRIRPQGPAGGRVPFE